MELSSKAWLEHFREQESLGISVGKYCRQTGLKVSKFYYWKKKLTQAAPKRQFVKVVSKGATAAQDKLIAIEFPGGARLTFPESLSSDRLGDIVAGVMRGVA